MNSSTMEPAWYEDPHAPEYDFIMHMAIQIAIGIATIVGNSFVFVAFAIFPDIREENNNLFIFALAVTDMLSGVLSVPLNILTKFVIPLYWRQIPVDVLTSQQFCLGTRFFQVYPSLSSYAMIAVIAIDRFVFIRWPLRYVHIMTRKNCIRLICSAFLYEAVAAGTGFALSAKEPFDPRRAVCVVEVVVSNTAVRLVSLSLVAYIPIAVSVVLHTFIAITAYKQRKRIHVETGNNPANESKIKQLRITKLMTKIVGVFALCVLPSLLSKAIPARLTNSAPWAISLKHFLSDGLYLNSAVNPLVYALSDRQFAKAFVKMIKCERR